MLFTNGDLYSDQTDRVMVSNFTDETSHYQALDWLPKLSGLREKLLPLKPRLKVVHQVLARLREIDPIFNAQANHLNLGREQTDDLLEFYLQRVEGHLQSVEALEHRLQGTLNLVSFSHHPLGLSDFTVD
jgi:hypothetical protein